MSLRMPRSFDAIVRSALMEMIEKRVSDGTILRLIGKFSGGGMMICLPSPFR